MAVFDRFKRNNKQDSVMPAEVQDYYKAERRNRTGTAWLLAILTLVVTFLLAAGLFFGGRFLYRTIVDNDDTSQTQQATDENSGIETNEDEDDTTSTASQSPSSRDTEDERTSSTNTTSLPAGPTDTTPAAPATTPNTGPSELVNTGPGDE